MLRTITLRRLLDTVVDAHCDDTDTDRRSRPVRRRFRPTRDGSEVHRGVSECAPVEKRTNAPTHPPTTLAIEGCVGVRRQCHRRAAMLESEFPERVDGIRFVRRPMMNSASIAGKPIPTLRRGIRQGILPRRTVAVLNGNCQMFPSPTALPTAARMNPALVAHVSRSLMSVGIFCWGIKTTSTQTKTFQRKSSNRFSSAFDTRHRVTTSNRGSFSS